MKVCLYEDGNDQVRETTQCKRGRGKVLYGIQGTEFPSFGNFDILSHTIPCCGDSLTYCRKFSSNPGLYPLDARSTPPPEVKL